MDRTEGSEPAANDLTCDVVLKGGVTSGVVFPSFLAELSRVYKFKSLGGTSAGAIGAAGGAIAELARLKGIDGAFAKLAALPEKLAERDADGRSRLLKLFEPQETTRAAFGVATEWLDTRQGALPWLSALLAAGRGFPIAALVGVASSAVLIGSAVVASSPWWGDFWRGLSTIVLLTFTVPAALLVGLLVLIGWAGLRSARALVRNGFGLSLGKTSESNRQPLTPWMHDLFNDLLGRPPDAEPVTFGELWQGAGDGRDEKRAIDLQVITTCLNLGRPFRIPNDPGQWSLPGFFYDPEEWSRYFPAEVMAWLETHVHDSDYRSPHLSREDKPLRALPEARDLPIVVAVRMSLSVPGLLSAVPLYMVDWTLEMNKEGPLHFEKVYFSDGAITSNFPIHLFDAPLPARPTFGVNLKDVHPDHRGKEDRVWWPGSHGGQLIYREPLPDKPGIGSIFAFIGAIIGTARTWRDTMQQTMTGYRDRIVHVSQSPGQGGFSLNMKRGDVLELAGYGKEAAQRLIAEFAVPPAAPGQHNAWQTHRWIRMRTTACSLGRYASTLGAQLDSGAPTYRELPSTTPPAWPFRDDGATVAAALLAGAGALSDAATATKVCARSPQPEAPLRLTPPW